MKRLRTALLTAGLVLTLGPPLLFATIAVLAYRAGPADQVGWAALVGGALITTMTVPQLGVIVLLVYVFVRMRK